MGVCAGRRAGNLEVSLPVKREGRKTEARLSMTAIPPQEISGLMMIGLFRAGQLRCCLVTLTTGRKSGTQW